MSDCEPSADPPEPDGSTREHRLSPSAAGLWAQCPRRWWYRYIDKLPEPPPGEPAVLGTFVHHILELLLAEPAADRDLERARVLARVAWADVEGSEEWDSLGLDEVAARRFRQRAWATVEAYFSCETPSDVVPVARELEVEVTLDGVPFRGFIDLVEQAPGSAVGAGGQQSIVITDYKTGKPPEKDKPWSEEQTTERLWQPLWYAAALSEMGDHLPVRARLLYFTALDARRGGGFDTRTGELSVDLDDEALGAARVELRRRWDDIAAARDAGHADASPGPLCGWCPYVDVCDEGRAEVERRWEERNDYTGERRLRHDAPAVTMLGLRDTEVLIA